VLPRHRIECAFRTAFEHLSLFLQLFCFGHGFCSCFSYQTGDVQDRDAEYGTD
jgi:hypothetical protein